MEEKKMTERESLELITTMINRTRERYIGDGNILLMWGYLTVIVTALVWIMLVMTHNPAWNWLWFAIGIVGGIATPIMSRKSDLKSGVKSYSDKVTSQIWTTVGLASVVATLFCFGFGLNGYNAWAMMFVIPLLDCTDGRNSPRHYRERKVTRRWRCHWIVCRAIHVLLYRWQRAPAHQLVPAAVHDCLRLHDDHPWPRD